MPDDSSSDDSLYESTGSSKAGAVSKIQNAISGYKKNSYGAQQAKKPVKQNIYKPDNS